MHRSLPWIASLLLVTGLWAEDPGPPVPPSGPVSTDIFRPRVNYRPRGAPSGAVREFYDDRGLIVRRITYRARYEPVAEGESEREYRILPADERTAEPMEIYDYEYDDRRRVIRQQAWVVGRGLLYVKETKYLEDRIRVVDEFGPEGELRARKRYAPKQGWTYLYPGGDGSTFVNISGYVHDESLFVWGSVSRGLSCAVTVDEREEPREATRVCAVLWNRTGGRIDVGRRGGETGFKTRLEDSRGDPHPLDILREESGPSGLESASRFRETPLLPGHARTVCFDLQNRYDELQPGRYTLLVERVGRDPEHFVPCPVAHLELE